MNGQMEKEKQIEEMARDVAVGIQRATEECRKTPNCNDCRLDGKSDCASYFIAEHLYEEGYRKASEVVAEVVTEIKNFITNEIAKREYRTEIEIKTQAKTHNRVWAMLDKIEEKKGE